MAVRSVAVSVVLLGVALLVACGDDGPLSEAKYAGEAQAVSERRDDAIEDAVAAITAALETQSPEAAARVLAAELPTLITAFERSIDEMRALTPPETYAADHTRLIAGRQAMVAVWERMLDAAQAGDAVRVQELEQERARIGRELVADLSAAFRDFTYVSELAESLSETFGGLEEAETAYLNGIRAGMQEFNRRVADFGQRLSQQFNSSASFFAALEGAGAGTAFEAAQTVVLQIDPPAGYAEEHQRVLRYFDEAVRLDREVGRSIDEGDIVLFALSNIGLFQNGGLAGLDLSPPVCSVLFPRSFCRAPDDLPGGDYGVQLYAALREFSARFGPDGQLQGQLALLSFMSDDELYALVTAVAPDLEAIVTGARATVAALTPPAGLTADHGRLLQFFDDTVSAVQAIEDAAAASDRDAVLSASRGVGGLRRTTAGDLSDAIGPITDVHFADP